MYKWHLDNKTDGFTDSSRHPAQAPIKQLRHFDAERHGLLLCYITLPLAPIHNHTSYPHYSTENAWLLGILDDENIHFIYLELGLPGWSLEIKHLTFMRVQVRLEEHSFPYRCL